MMNNIFSSVLLTIILCGHLTTFAQQSKVSNKVRVLTITSDILYPVLDTAIAFESKCKFNEQKWAKNLFYTLQFREVRPDTFNVEIGSWADMEGAHTLNPVGVFDYKGYKVFCYGKIPEELIHSTNSYKEVSYYKKNENEVWPDDDSHTQWFYWYVNKQLFFEKMGNICER